MKKSKSFLFLCMLLLLQLYAGLYAAKITVTTVADTGPGSLRNAVSSAAPNDTIVFAPALNNQTIVLTSGEIAVEKNLTILGPGVSKLTVNGNANSRIFLNTSCNVTFTIDGLTLTNGRVNANEYGALGGAIVACGILNIRNSVITNNHIYGDGLFQVAGGAIYSSGNLNLINSKVTYNSATAYTITGDAGGIYSEGYATIINSEIAYNTASGFFSLAGGIRTIRSLYLENSTVHHNISSGDKGAGAAIHNTYSGGIITIVNSTISSNQSSGKGSATGGIYSAGTLKLYNSTITKNNASYEDGTDGSGISVTNTGTLFIANTIVARNGSYNEYGVDGLIAGTVNDQGYNLIGVNEGFNLVNSTDKTGTLASPLDPLLGPLQDNGGSTPTHALLPGSPAIDAGNPWSTLAKDQRGVARPYNGRIDIGSFELSSGILPQVVITSPASGAMFSAPANITINATVTGAGQGAYIRVTNPSGGWRKLKLGYDSIGIYHGSQNVTATGNNLLEITLRDFTGTADWSKLQIRPNGSTANPLSLAPYVAAAGGVSGQFTTIRIPLADFDPSINFTQLKMFELPYSINAGSFNIGIQKIIFTGGTMPFLWFGDRKTDNAFDGTGAPGELVASLIPATGFGGVNKVAFYNGNAKIGEDYTKPYSIVWHNVPAGNYQITAVATTNNGTVITSPPVSIHVVAASTIFSAEKTGNDPDVNNSMTVYPNPVQHKLTITGVSRNMSMSIYNDQGSKVYEQALDNLAQGEADLSALPPGLYILRMEGADREHSKVVKLIKQ